MANEVPWYRMYNEVMADTKLKRVAGRSKVPPLMALGAWTMFLTIASTSPKRGRLLFAEGIPWQKGDLIDEMGIPEAEAILEAFVSLGLLVEDEQGVYEVSQWHSRQYDSDSSTDRVRKYRAKTKRDETPMKRSVTVAETPSEYRDQNNTYTANAAPDALLDEFPEPDGLWDDGLAEDLQAVVNAAAPAAAGDSFADAYKALADQGFDGFPKPKNQRDLNLLPLVKTPAVFTWVSVTFHTPEYDQLPYLVKQLGPNPNREVLATVWEMWRGNGYSPGKITGVLEWYQLRLKDSNWQPTYGQKARASPNGNGAAAKGGRQKANGKQSEFDPDTIGQVL